MSLLAALSVFVGAGLGALLRCLLGQRLNPVLPSIPLGTLTANLIGGFLAGYLLIWLNRHPALPPDFRLPGIPALPQHKADVRAAGEWAVARMTRAGLANAAILETAGHPATYADWLGAPGKPTLLFYGHFDVQPVDPLSLWTTPPFEPEIRDGRIYARGASDDKSGVLSLIQAIEGVLKGEGSLPVNIKLLFEGEEEIGSANLKAVLAERKAQLACDHIISVDGGQWSETDGGILVSLKGMCGGQIDVYGAATDLHSGIFGGAAANPCLFYTSDAADERSRVDLGGRRIIKKQKNG